MTTGTETVQIRAKQCIVKRLGDWTTCRRFDVRASRGIVVLDLLLPELEPGEIEIALDIDHATVKLLVPDGAAISDDDVRRVGRGRVKDWTGTAAPGGRTIKLVGEMRNAEVRIHRGGVAALSLLTSRTTRRQVRKAYRSGRFNPAADEGENPVTDQTTPNGYDRRSEELWASIGDYDEQAFRAQIDELVAELPVDNPLVAFERACAFDSTGEPERAVPLYRQALERGLDGERRRRAVIQLASSLRNLNQVAESVALLEAERDQPSDRLDDAVTAFLALALVDSGHEREAVSVALAALAAHLPRYRRSLTNYAQALVEERVPE